MKVFTTTHARPIHLPAGAGLQPGRRYSHPELGEVVFVSCSDGMGELRTSEGETIHVGIITMQLLKPL